ncbi:MAG TPA: HAD family hydrolase [Planctomycetota bacterium]|nr:HAD family hydrolase [Planctomycetota bacterium]
MKLLLWDFDGTLAYRDGMWTQALLDVLREHAPHLAVTREQIRPFLQSGFPWHDPDLPHTHIMTADDWWENLVPVFERAFASVGVPPAEAPGFAMYVRKTFLGVEHWHLFPDTVPSLSALADVGWTHWILSNHVPELGQLADGLGLGQLIQSVFTSARTGYEKPHPSAFEHVLRKTAPGSTVWMIGDSMVADVEGATKVGLSAILVRKQAAGVIHYCCDLYGISRIVNA